MAYRFQRSRSVQKCVRAIACEQIDKAIGEIDAEDMDRHEAVHQVRKRCKKIRGLVRLVRPCFDNYRNENRFFRDAAKKLSGLRDAQSVIDCYDQLLNRFQDQIDQDQLASVRTALVERRQQVADDVSGLRLLLDELRCKLTQARCRARKWKIHGHGFAAIRGGLVKSYGRGRVAMRNAYREPTVENFHEWRKRVKYHGYHASLLRRSWPAMLKPQCRVSSQLSELLGDDHDLAVFRQILQDEDSQLGTASDRQVLFGLVDRRRLEIQAEAHPIGARLFAEKPKQLAARWQSYWSTWKALDQA